LSEEVPVDYQKIRVCFMIDADISTEQKEEMIRMAKKNWVNPRFSKGMRA
jgi:hypothetical protein